MVSKCANPACSSVFRYLHEGKIFRLVARPTPQNEGLRKARSHERFWLCSACASHMTITGAPNGEILVVPIAELSEVEKLRRDQSMAFGSSEKASAADASSRS